MMDQDLNDKMKQAQEGLARLSKINSILNELSIEKETLDGEMQALKTVREKEESDVDKLEHTSIWSVFYSVLGSLEEHTDKERREALAAKLKYDHSLRALEDVIYQIEKLTAERKDYAGCQKEYDRLYSEKKEVLLSETGAQAEELMDMIEKFNRSDLQLKEIGEALSKGREVIRSLNQVQDSLGRAEGWGTWDLLGGGLISDLAKHSNIDDAKMEVEDTQRLLRQFKTELVDIKISADITINTDGFGKFADFFFDGLIADWFMQSNIHESQESVSNVSYQVSGILEKLNDLQSQASNERKMWKEKLDALIVNA
jgi:hypothetical protein